MGEILSIADLLVGSEFDRQKQITFVTVAFQERPLHAFGPPRRRLPGGTPGNEVFLCLHYF
jgi:hypothetical protein